VLPTEKSAYTCMHIQIYITSRLPLGISGWCGVGVGAGVGEPFFVCARCMCARRVCVLVCARCMCARLPPGCVCEMACAHGLCARLPPGCVCEFACVLFVCPATARVCM